MSVMHAPQSASQPITLPISKGMLWLAAAAIAALAVYYFVGVDEGALSVFGKSMIVHEFVHDSRHFLGFPCH
ncbi:MAG TPA: CbtB-domain containing protein [Streptosporangiaceae bacterium]|jgi:cobalt transporter subunit CbtB